MGSKLKAHGAPLNIYYSISQHKKQNNSCYQVMYHLKVWGFSFFFFFFTALVSKESSYTVCLIKTSQQKTSIPCFFWGGEQGLMSKLSNAPVSNKLIANIIREAICPNTHSRFCCRATAGIAIEADTV